MIIRPCPKWRREGSACECVAHSCTQCKGCTQVPPSSTHMPALNLFHGGGYLTLSLVSVRFTAYCKRPSNHHISLKQGAGRTWILAVAFHCSPNSSMNLSSWARSAGAGPSHSASSRRRTWLHACIMARRPGRDTEQPWRVCCCCCCCCCVVMHKAHVTGETNRWGHKGTVKESSSELGSSPPTPASCIQRVCHSHCVSSVSCVGLTRTFRHTMEGHRSAIHDTPVSVTS